MVSLIYRKSIGTIKCWISRWEEFKSAKRLSDVINPRNFNKDEKDFTIWYCQSHPCSFLDDARVQVYEGIWNVCNRHINMEHHSWGWINNESNWKTCVRDKTPKKTSRRCTLNSCFFGDIHRFKKQKLIFITFDTFNK